MANRNKKTANRREENKTSQSNYDKNGRNSKSNKNRGQKPGKDDEEAVVSKTDAQAKFNDANWYFTNPEVAGQAAQLSFQSYLGVPGTISEYTMPTIMTIHLNPSPGNTYPGATFAQHQRSGFNMSMTRLFNRLSMKSGRNMVYAPQDVGMAVLGIGELLSMVSYARRLFGVVRWWNVRNRMVPKQVIKAMGIEPEDFFKNFSDYRMRMNTLIMACNQIPILMNSGYLRKCATLYDNIYKDCDTNMCQYYIYVPNTTWILDESADQRGTLARTISVVEAFDNNVPVVRTFDKFLTDIMEPMVAALLQSSTLNLVYADILNLNKTEDLSLASIDVISEEYAIIPVYDTMVLKQIHNTTVLDQTNTNTESSTTTHWNDVVCDPDHNCVKYSPIFQLGREYTVVPSAPNVSYIIDTDTSDPTIEEKVEITRYLSAIGPSLWKDASGIWSKWNPIPDHYASGMIIFTDEVDQSHALFAESFWVEDSDAVKLQRCIKISQFDWHPIMYNMRNETDGYHVVGLVGDLNSFTLVDEAYMRRLNSIIYMDLFEFRQ